VSEPTTRGGYLFGQFGWSQQSPRKQRTSILDDTPCCAECGLFEDVVDVTAQESEFGHPVFIENEAFRGIQPSQPPPP
jgi:hypothetical protein